MLRVRYLVSLVFLAASCGGLAGKSPTPLVTAGAETPVAAVEGLVEAISDGNFAAAAGLAVPGQAAMASLAEGATFGEIATALREGDEEVAANFWSGFAQGAGSFLAGDVAVEEEGTVDDDGVEFHQVVVDPETGPDRTVMVREDDGYRVDLFASFGQGLADRMTPAVERLLTAGTGDSRLILDRLQDIVPSLLAAARLSSTTPEISQQLLALVEVITRFG